MNRNQFTGGLEPLRGFTVLHTLDLDQNKLTGGLEPLRGCTALDLLYLDDNNLTGGLESHLGAARHCTFSTSRAIIWQAASSRSGAARP